MVSFSHLDDGTPEDAWAAAGAGGLAVLDDADLPGPGDRLLVLAAHPDDESLGAAGLMHTALRRGAAVRVVLCTAGEASHPDSPTHTPERLARLRLEEFAAGLRALDPSGPGPDWRCLHLPDGGLDALDAALDDALRGEASGATHLAAPYRSDGHADHDALGAAAARAAAGAGAVLLEFPVWYWHWADPHRDAAWRQWQLLRLDPTAADAKKRALAVHRSQNAALSPAAGDEALLSEDFLRHFDRPAETFRATHPGPRGAAAAATVFDGLHTRRPDPWNARTSWYERRKRAATLAALPREEYAAALEAGCSIGTLTRDLAGRCRSLTAIDASSVALDAAREHLADVPGVSLLQAQLPAGWPAAPASLDLVVASEVGYFLTAREWDALLGAAAGSLVGGGHLVLCHWLGPIEGWELDGETVHAMARRRTGWRVLVAHRESEFLLEVLEKPVHG